jgi:hypothetical protein
VNHLESSGAHLCCCVFELSLKKRGVGEGREEKNEKVVVLLQEISFLERWKREGFGRVGSVVWEWCGPFPL